MHMTAQVIIVEAMDKIMSHHRIRKTDPILSYENAKPMWEVIELMMEETDEVKENEYDM